MCWRSRVPDCSSELDRDRRHSSMPKHPDTPGILHRHATRIDIRSVGGYPGRETQVGLPNRGTAATWHADSAAGTSRNAQVKAPTLPLYCALGELGGGRKPTAVLGETHRLQMCTHGRFRRNYSITHSSTGEWKHINTRHTKQAAIIRQSCRMCADLRLDSKL
jgi:hypothetical protein